MGLADFGLLKRAREHNTKTPCGAGTAPRLARRYSKEVDMQTIGCVLWPHGRFPPFYDESAWLDEGGSRQYTFLTPWWDGQNVCRGS